MTIVWVLLAIMSTDFRVTATVMTPITTTTPGGEVMGYEAPVSITESLVNGITITTVVY